MTIRFSTGLRQYIANTGSFKAAMADGILRGYSGSQPSSADNAESGTLLFEITESGGAFSSGFATNGLEFGTAVAGVIAKATAETWKDNAANATGTAGYFRFYANTVVTGASTTAVRFDGSIGVGTGDLQVSTTSVTADAPISISFFQVTFPESN